MVDVNVLNDLHKVQKNNCCQCVVRYFEDQLDIDPVTLLRVAEGFGLGCGCMDGQCGALSGAIILAGIRLSDQNTKQHASNPATYKVSREIVEKFRERAGAITCRDIKGVDTGVKLCSCDDAIRIGCEIAEEVLFRK